MIQGSERIWFALAPEGTRKRVEQWKTGFWKIARAADVPIVMAYFHYPEKTIGIADVFHTSDNLEQDMARIREWYRPWHGRNRDTR